MLNRKKKKFKKNNKNRKKQQKTNYVSLLGLMAVVMLLIAILNQLIQSNRIESLLDDQKLALERIERLFGKKEADNIREMTKIKLKRKIFENE